MSNARENAINVVSVQYWRERFHELKRRVELVEPKTSLRVALIKGNDFYDSAVGGYEYANLLKNKAGIEKTRRAVLALEKFLSVDRNKPKYLKNISLP